MNGEKIIKKYPNLFENATKPPTETCMCWGLECDEGWHELIDNLCDFLENQKSFSYIDLYDERGNLNQIRYSYPNVVFDQIKEKFGSLTIYFRVKAPELNDYIDKMSEYLHLSIFRKIFMKLFQRKKFNSIEKNSIELEKVYRHINSYAEGVVGFAEALSRKTCEVTGKSGKLRKNGCWYKTVCDEIAEKEGYEEILQEKEES